MFTKFTVLIEKDKFGYYAYCPELKGCQSQGYTFEEAFDNIKEAIELYLEVLDDEEKQLLAHKQIFTSSIEVAIA